MLLMKALRLALGTLLASDSSTLAPATLPNKMGLAKNNFSLTENLVIGDIVAADFDGSTLIPGAAGAQQTGLDPATNDQVLTIKDPAGGYRWITTGSTQLPQTIYGYYLVDTTGANLLMAGRFNTPITLTDVGQVINLGQADTTFVAQPAS